MLPEPAGDGLADFGLVGGCWLNDGYGVGAAVGLLLVEGGGREDVAVGDAVGVVVVILAVLVGVGGGDQFVEDLGVAARVEIGRELVGAHTACSGGWSWENVPVAVAGFATGEKGTDGRLGLSFRLAGAEALEEPEADDSEHGDTGCW